MLRFYRSCLPVCNLPPFLIRLPLPVAFPGGKARAGVFPEMGQWRRGDWALQLRSGEKMPSEVKRMRNGDMLRFLWTDGQK